ncbi:heparin lyase I family protein [Yersinia alsatica]|uniref:heparin lyase I family protein n=1 Tax=Yersinia alsatica TaxID=2890317 RepID=UPI0032EC1D42
MSVVETCLENAVNSENIKGEKIRSRFHRFDQGGIDALAGYSVSMNTPSQNWHHRENTTPTEAEREKNKAIELQHISIRQKEESNENDKDLTFSLPKEKGNYRSEISAPGAIKIDTESSYSFDFKATSLPNDLIIYQIRELEGSMSTLGGDRPSFALRIKHDGTLICTFNSVNQNTLSTEPNGNTFQNENISLNKLELEKYYNIKIDIVMHRDHPSLKISLDDELILQRDTLFGAVDSKTFYNKYGAYAARQKNKEGISDSEVTFDNIKEAHYQYLPPITAENNTCLAPLTDNNLLPAAIAAFNIDEHDVAPPSFNSQSVTPETTLVAPALIL